MSTFTHYCTNKQQGHTSMFTPAPSLYALQEKRTPRNTCNHLLKQVIVTDNSSVWALDYWTCDLHVLAGWYRKQKTQRSMEFEALQCHQFHLFLIYIQMLNFPCSCVKTTSIPLSFVISTKSTHTWPKNFR